MEKYAHREVFWRGCFGTSEGKIVYHFRAKIFSPGTRIIKLFKFS